MPNAGTYELREIDYSRDISYINRRQSQPYDVLVTIPIPVAEVFDPLQLVAHRCWACIRVNAPAPG